MVKAPITKYIYMECKVIITIDIERYKIKLIENEKKKIKFTIWLHL